MTKSGISRGKHGFWPLYVLHLLALILATVHLLKPGDHASSRMELPQTQRPAICWEVPEKMT